MRRLMHSLYYASWLDSDQPFSIGEFCSNPAYFAETQDVWLVMPNDAVDELTELIQPSGAVRAP